MATSTKTKSKSSGKKSAPKRKASSAKKKNSRCWPGYEPTPGKKAFTKGSCRKK